MTDQMRAEKETKESPAGLPRVRLPGFIKDEEIGLGDAIKRVTFGFGLKPCGGCERRATALNRWMVFRR